jgi:hypothetical protein
MDKDRLMPDYGTSQLELIDQRVKAGLRTVTKMGTVQARDTLGARTMVALDGSSGVAQPVKCFSNVIVQEGDRVGLVKFESDWVIVGNYTLRTLGSANWTQEFTSGGTTTSATYVDQPTSPTANLVKARDTTQLRVRIAMSLYVTAQPTVVRAGIRLTNTEAAVDFDQDVIRMCLNAANSHQGYAGTITTSASLPGGNYSATARWLRVSGSGTVTVDSNDQISIEVEEVVT